MLTRNKLTGCYEGTVQARLSIPEEFVNRAVLKELAESGTDVTDIGAYTALVKRICDVAKWENHPHAQLTLCKSEQERAPNNGAAPTKESFLPSSISVIRPELTEQAKNVPPYNWPSLLEPMPPAQAKLSAQERRRVSRRRENQRAVLKELTQNISREISH